MNKDKLDKIKWIVSDLDGTLLLEDKEIYENDTKDTVYPKTAELVNHFIREGYIFSVATGRHYYDAYMLTKPQIEFSKDSFIIGLNGAQIYSIKQEKLIFEKPFLEKEHLELENVLTKITDLFNKKLLIFVYCEDKDLVFLETELSRQVSEFDPKIEKFITRVLNVRNSKNFKEMKKIWKIVLYDTTEKTDVWEVLDRIKEMSTHFDYVISGDHYLEIMPKGISKGAAIDYLNEHFFKLSKKEIMSFGDSCNDLEMFERSEIAITRKSAHEHIQKHATDIYEGDPSKFIANALVDFKNKI